MPLDAPNDSSPLILALDLGTSSLRALIVDHHGQIVRDSEDQRSYRMRTTADGGVEVDAPPLFDLLVSVIDGAVERAGARAAHIAAVGVTSFWHSLLGLDANDEPVTPVFSWADSRSAAQARQLRNETDEIAVHRRTGCRFHSSYWPAKLRWLQATAPKTYHRATRWVSFAEYAAGRLCAGAPRQVTFSMASGTGLLDVHHLVWDAPLLDLLGLSPDRLSALVDTGETTSLATELARRWPALDGTPWLPAIGDGAAANVGSGAIGADRMALTLGTSGAMRMVVPAAKATVPTDLWAYRLDRAQMVLGGALSNGGNVQRWTRELLSVPIDGPVMARVNDLPPDSHGLTMLPFVSGERSPGWHDGATGVIAGLTLATRPGDLVRAAMEAVAYRFGRIFDTLRPLSPASDTELEIVANGGAIVNSPVWLQIVADTLGHPIIALPAEDEATARGAAIVAQIAVGILPDLAAASDPTVEATTYLPDVERHRRYQAGRERQARLEATLFPEGAQNIDW